MILFWSIVNMYCQRYYRKVSIWPAIELILLTSGSLIPQEVFRLNGMRKCAVSCVCDPLVCFPAVLERDYTGSPHHRASSKRGKKTRNYTTPTEWQCTLDLSVCVEQRVLFMYSYSVTRTLCGMGGYDTMGFAVESNERWTVLIGYSVPLHERGGCSSLSFRQTRHKWFPQEQMFGVTVQWRKY